MENRSGFALDFEQSIKENEFLKSIKSCKRHSSMRVKDTKTISLEEEFFRRSPKEMAAFLAHCCLIVRVNDITLFILATLVD